MNPIYDDYTGEYYDGSGNVSEDPAVIRARVRKAMAALENQRRCKTLIRRLFLAGLLMIVAGSILLVLGTWGLFS